MSNPPDNLRLRALLDEALATGNAAIIKQHQLEAVNKSLLTACMLFVAYSHSVCTDEEILNLMKANALAAAKQAIKDAEAL